MKPPRFFAVLALVALGVVAAWETTTRLRAPERPKPAAPASAPVAPRVVERRPLVAPAPSASPKTSEPALLDPGSRWTELNNQAATALAAGDIEGAAADFQRCLEAEPANATFAGNLAETLVRLARIEHDRGELDKAVTHLARAIELAPGRADIETLKQILARWRTELELSQNDWTEDSSDFELSFDTNRDDVLHHSHEVLEHLEETYEDLVRWFGVDPFPKGNRIRVAIYKREDFDRLTGLGDWAAGVFDGVVRVSVEDLTTGSGWRSVLVHELVHAFVQALAGSNVPGWLNEGLAQMLENRPGAVPRLRDHLEGVSLFPLERLAGTLASWQDTSEIGRAYAESLVFVDYLRATYGEESLRRMLSGLKAGGTAAAAFESWTQVPLATAFEDWSESLSR